ncbi:unnamed protein product [Rhizoctonia solani]|uniref:SnoaL-like domain-containing protein n=1 Tax=Rhizoctonia solani TaxID=456999 RepID=A0A8H3DW66_9AGAM|nr:unnamed protein product [Rhizoctonia solani]
MTLPTAQISAPGLTEEQIQVERAWLAGFVQAVDTLDWSKWEGWWAQDGFIQFGNSPRVQGKEAIAVFHKQAFGAFEYLHHEITRCTFDVALGLIYQTTTLTVRIKGDPEKRTIRVPGLGVIHKKVGEIQTTGNEVYIDTSPVMSVVQEVLSLKAENI